MEPTSTVQNGHKWKIWHATNYCIGGTFFLFGSILLFPFFATFMNSGTISAWLYTIGSLCFCFSDYTEWAHYQRRAICKGKDQWCKHMGFSTNFFTSFFGSSVYLIGSSLFLPQINKMNEGLILFIIGSSIIFISQSWKLLRTVMYGRKINSIKKAFNQDLTGAFVDAFAGLGATCYFSGSFVFFNPSAIAQFVAVVIFCCGGFCFYLSGIFMLKRYFIQPKFNRGSISISSSQSKFQKDMQMAENIQEQA